jgi:hypothetical protein
MVDAVDAYKKHQLENELREKLFEAFRKNSAKRAERLELEKRLEKIVTELKENDGVTAILSDNRYSKIELRESRAWLKEIEQEVADAYSKTQRKMKKSRKRIKGGEGLERGERKTKHHKVQMLVGWLKASKQQEFTLKEVADGLGITGQASTWLNALDLPSGCVIDSIPGNKRAGKKLLRDKVLKMVGTMETA